MIGSLVTVVDLLDNTGAHRPDMLMGVDLPMMPSEHGTLPRSTARQYNS
jgi:hypothetical protein